jgi:hypothetical protein
MANEDSRLRVLARRHEAYYDIWPEYSLVSGRQVPIGFALELCGLRNQHEQKLTPGDPASHNTYSELREIAGAVIGPSISEAEYHIQPFDNAIHECPARRFRPEIVLSVDITPKPSNSLPGYENTCLQAVERTLVDLGVHRGRGISSRSHE